MCEWCVCVITWIGWKMDGWIGLSGCGKWMWMWKVESGKWRGSGSHTVRPSSRTVGVNTLQTPLHNGLRCVFWSINRNAKNAATCKQLYADTCADTATFGLLYSVRGPHVTRQSAHHQPRRWTSPVGLCWRYAVVPSHAGIDYSCRSVSAQGLHPWRQTLVRRERPSAQCRQVRGHDHPSTPSMSLPKTTPPP